MSEAHAGSKPPVKRKRLADRILEYFKDRPKPGEGVLGLTLFKELYIGPDRMRRAIFENQDRGEWISGVKQLSGKHQGDTLYKYHGSSETKPDDYLGPIRRSRSKKA